MRRSSRKKNSTKIFIAVTLLAALIFGVSNYLVNKANEVVIAKVNDQKILKSEIERKLRSVFDSQNLGAQGQEMKVPEIDTLPKEVIEILIKEVYLEKELTKEAKKSKVSEDKEVKYKVADAQDKIVRQAYIDFLIKQEITEQKISDKYVELSNELAGKKEYLVSHIVVKTKEEADKILKDLKSKKSSPNKFSELAKKYSIDQESAEKGGELGYILEDNMIKEISDAVANLPKNEISNPVQTKFGWHLIKVSDIRDAKALPFESVKDNIRDQLIQDKINEINSKITKDAKIQLLIELKGPEQKQVGENPTQQPTEQNSIQALPAEQQAVSTEEAVALENPNAPANENAETNSNENSEANSTEKTDEEKVEQKEKSSEKSNAKAKHKKAKHKKHSR